MDGGFRTEEAACLTVLVENRTTALKGVGRKSFNIVHLHRESYMLQHFE